MWVGDDYPALTDDDSASGLYVCYQCLGDPYLKKDVRRRGCVRLCSYCGRNRRAVAIESLAEQAAAVYEALIAVGDEYPIISDDSDKVYWQVEGDYPETVMSEIIEPDDEKISSDIVAYLSDRDAWRVHEGDFDYYDDASDIYKISIPRDFTYRLAWESFTNSIRHESRFFNEGARQILRDLLDPVLSGVWPKNGSAIRMLRPDDELSIYRGRTANDLEQRRQIYSSPIRQLSAPPAAMNSAGRMNPAGIPVFYGSFDRATCAAELRPPVGGLVVTGEFAIVRPLRVLDLTVLEGAHFRMSFFDPDFLDTYAYNEFLRGFHAEIRKPVIPGAEALDYLPTQAVAEYLWKHPKFPIDGIIFGSAQISGSSNNIALLPPATTVEGYVAEVRRDVESLRPFNEDDQSEWVFLKKAEVDAIQDQIDYGGEASLKLLPGRLVALGITGINYDIVTIPVTLAEWEASTQEVDQELPDLSDSDFGF